ncbi:uncharacterized protein LOC104904280 [Beta vulgaris subsp. vulgaris]|uniref:uncharacterized protein LOC104904280 n=1 Tax=Beta vulgaris subsp. vulgaris TaxID=3555 RepID=UPI00203750E1|nr:uncharacterized protein LOC104904280 [Beta vulgaris subsp. vulgaris]
MLKLGYYNNGVKALKFIDSIRHLIFYSTSTSIKSNPYFGNYLIEHLGFSKQLARSTSTKFNQIQCRRIKKVSSSKFVSNADSVLAYLRQNGLNDTHIRIVVSSLPNILVSRIKQTLKPKVDYFMNFGFSKSDFAQVVSINPYVLLNGQFIRAIEALKDVMGCDNHVNIIRIMKKSNWNTTSGLSNNLIPNVAVLRDYGISIELIRDRLLVHPHPFLRRTVIFKDLLVRVEKDLGIPRYSSRFLLGLHLLASFSQNNIESKIKMFESFGWMRSDVMDLIRANPFCLALSEARIKKSLEFLMNDLVYEPAYIASHNVMLGYSLEKRIVPRNKVLLALKEKGLIKMHHSLYTTLLLSEPRFLERYVLPFEEVHEVYAKHTGRSPLQPLTEGGVGDKDGL